MKRPLNSEPFLYEPMGQGIGTTLEEPRISAEYADFSVTIVSELARSQNLVNDNAGTEYDG